METAPERLTLDFFVKLRYFFTLILPVLLAIESKYVLGHNRK